MNIQLSYRRPKGRYIQLEPRSCFEYRLEKEHDGVDATFVIYAKDKKLYITKQKRK